MRSGFRRSTTCALRVLTLTGKTGSALLPAASAVSWHEIAQNVNAQEGVMWKAEVPSKFSAPEDVKDLVGAFVLGDAK